MNFKNKKGVSDVVTTVLIILLVLAAVAIVGSVVLRSVGNTAQAIDRNSICAEPVVAIGSCTYSAANGVFLVTGVKKNNNYPLSGNAIANIEGSVGNVLVATWTTATFAGGNPITSASYPSAVPTGANYAFVTFSVTGPNGAVVGCTSSRVLCTT